MQAGWFRKLVCCLAAMAIWPFAAAASLPEGALLQVRPFVFPKAAYQGAEEEAGRLSSAFYRQLLAALEERNTFRRDASYLKFCRYKLEASAVGAALTQVERFLQEL